MKPVALAIPINWRRGIAVTVALHGSLALALATHIRTAEQIQAPAFSIELAATSAQTPEPSTDTPAHASASEIPPPTTEAGSLARSTDAVAMRQDQGKPNMAALRAIQPAEAAGKAEPSAATAAPAPPASAPAAPSTVTAARPSAPSAEAVSDPSAQARASWEAQVMARLEAGKRYPASARFAREQGTAYVTFTVGQNGRAYGVRLVRDSGHRDLDNEALELLHRVKLPAPPASMDHDPVLTAPIEFTLKWQ